jgi:glutaminyl-peptide cyclotransferase
MAANLMALFLGAALAAGCSQKSPPAIPWQSFSGERAMAQAEKLVSFGPRPSGSEAMKQQGDYIAAQLREFGLEVEEQTFQANTPRGPVEFRNLIGKTRGGAGPVILIGAHYDTKWFTNMTFVGANDGASGSAVLLELARVTASQPNLWFVFFDGEECVRDYGADDGLHGSRHFVQSAGNIRAMVLLDMVGDAHLNIRLPLNGDPTLTEQVFEAARDTGHRDYFCLGKGEILDDHVPFLQDGIPAVDLIDFEYGSAPGLNDYWHTDQDTLDKLSPKSLAVVGQTVLRMITLLEQTPRP